MKNIVPPKIRLLTLACLQAGLIAMGFGSSAASGAVLATHSGANNPTSEGWGIVQGGSTGLSYKASTFNGKPVWAINDSTVSPSDGNTRGAYYQKVLDASTNYSLEGWNLQANVQVLNGSGMQFAYTTKYAIDGTILTSNNRKTYAVLLGNTSGKITISLSGYNGNAALTSVADTNLVDIRLSFNPGSTGVSLYVNNQLIVSDYTGASLTNGNANILWWGKLSSNPGNRTSNWESVQFSTVPEPGSVALTVLSLGVVFLLPKLRGKLN